MKSQHIITNKKEEVFGFSQPINFDSLTDVETDSDVFRHIEQLWDEVKKLKEEIHKLKTGNR